jgi:hypothetical protein
MVQAQRLPGMLFVMQLVDQKQSAGPDNLRIEK